MFLLSEHKISQATHDLEILAYVPFLIFFGNNLYQGTLWVLKKQIQKSNYRHKNIFSL